MESESSLVPTVRSSTSEDDRSFLQEQRGWRVESIDQASAQRLAGEVGCSTVVASLLIQRGVTDGASATSFLKPTLHQLHPPETVPDIERAVDIMQDVIARRARICIYGDYDVDGLTATALLVRTLRHLKVDVITYVPDRLTEGYGVNSEAIRKIAADRAALVITVDGGANNVEELRLALELGMQVIVTDHHPVRELIAEVPIVHPGRPDRTAPFADLCGAGVAYKLLWALGRRRSAGERVSRAYRTHMVECLAMVALGTVADVVPLIDENRVFVRFGLESLARTPYAGLRALMQQCRVGDNGVQADDIGFRLGRAGDALDVLLCDDPEEAKVMVEGLARANRRRKEIEKKILDACEEQVAALDPESTSATAPLVLSGEGWHPGVAGIVAARMVDRHHRPVFVIGIDAGIGRGSARTVREIPLQPFYEAGEEIVDSIGGHAMAGGLVIAPDRIDRFRQAVQAVPTPVSVVDRGIRVQMKIALEDVNTELLARLEQLAPFGNANPVPRFLVEGLKLAEPPRLVGKAEEHLAFQVKGPRGRVRAIFFRGAAWARRLRETRRPFAVVCEVTANRFSGRVSAELRILDIGL